MRLRVRRPDDSPEAPYARRIGSTPPRTDVLLVEDDPTVTAIVRTTLEQAGYDVREAGDGISAQIQIASQFPDVLVVDLGLPDGNGLDLVRTLRAHALGEPFIIVLSGFRQEQKVLAAFEAGADDFVTKPFSPRELVARIKRQTST